MEIKFLSKIIKEPRFLHNNLHDKSQEFHETAFRRTEMIEGIQDLGLPVEVIIKGRDETIQQVIEEAGEVEGQRDNSNE